MNTRADLLLRVAVAFSFLYPPIDAWFAPDSLIGYIPQFALAMAPVSGAVFLHAFGVVEIVLALWLLAGWKAWIPSALMGILLVLIVATNMNQFEVLFRDLSIALAAFALAWVHWPSKNPQTL